MTGFHLISYCPSSHFILCRYLPGIFCNYIHEYDWLGNDFSAWTGNFIAIWQKHFMKPTVREIEWQSIVGSVSCRPSDLASVSHWRTFFCFIQNSFAIHVSFTYSVFANEALLRRTKLRQQRDLALTGYKQEFFSSSIPSEEFVRRDQKTNDANPSFT